VGDISSRCGVKIIDRILSDSKFGITFDPKVQYYAIFGNDITFADSQNGAFCDDDTACGLHNQQNHTVNRVGTPYLQAWVTANPDGCTSSTIAGLANAAGSPSVISTLGTLAHEIVETITDPEQDPSSKRAWQTATEGSENADLCGDYFGTIKGSTKQAKAYYNVLANGNEYLIPGHWSNLDSGCSIELAITDETPSGTLAAASQTHTLTAAASATNSPAAGASGSASGAAPSGSATGAPSGSATGAAPSGSASADPLPSISVVASGTGTASNIGPLPSDACITFGDNRVYRHYRKFKKICEHSLGGSFFNGTTTPGETGLCCNGITKFTPFSWSVQALNCEYGIPTRKQDALCDAIGGRTSCSIGILGAVRITCSRS